MPWKLLLSLVPELVRGIVAITREHIARKKAEAEARKAEAEGKSNDKQPTSP